MKKKTGTKLDGGKPDWSLLPMGTVDLVVKVLTFGAEKYERDNWQKVEHLPERYYSASMRHIDAWWRGEMHDPESGIHHLAHAACCLLFLIWWDEERDNG